MYATMYILPTSFEVAGDTLGSSLCIYVKNTDEVRRSNPTIREIFITFDNNRTFFKSCDTNFCEKLSLPDGRKLGFVDGQDGRMLGFPDGRMLGFPDGRMLGFTDGRMLGLPDPRRLDLRDGGS